jgi:hypothetical protein
MCDPISFFARHIGVIPRWFRAHAQFWRIVVIAASSRIDTGHVM